VRRQEDLSVTVVSQMNNGGQVGGDVDHELTSVLRRVMSMRQMRDRIADRDAVMLKCGVQGPAKARGQLTRDRQEGSATTAAARHLVLKDMCVSPVTTQQFT